MDPEDEIRDATYIPESVEIKRHRGGIFAERFAQGQRNAEEHMRRMLTTRDLAGCPCLGCRRGARDDRDKNLSQSRRPA